jgi:hypothetical protein
VGCWSPGHDAAPAARGIRHTFYSDKRHLSEKYTGFRWRKLSFMSNIPDEAHAPQKSQQPPVGLMLLLPNREHG